MTIAFCRVCHQIDSAIFEWPTKETGVAISLSPPAWYIYWEFTALCVTCEVRRPIEFPYVALVGIPNSKNAIDPDALMHTADPETEPKDL